MHQSLDLKRPSSYQAGNIFPRSGHRPRSWSPQRVRRAESVRGRARALGVAGFGHTPAVPPNPTEGSRTHERGQRRRERCKDIFQFSLEQSERNDETERDYGDEHTVFDEGLTTLVRPEVVKQLHLYSFHKN